MLLLPLASARQPATVPPPQPLSRQGPPVPPSLKPVADSIRLPGAARVRAVIRSGLTGSAPSSPASKGVLLPPDGGPLVSLEHPVLLLRIARRTLRL